MKKMLSLFAILGALLLAIAAQGRVWQVWAQQYDAIVTSNSIATDQAGNVYVTAEKSVGANNHNFVTIKYSSIGAVLWEAEYEGGYNDQSPKLAIDTQGNVFVTGRSSAMGTFYDYAIVKYDGAGNQLWVARYNGPNNAYDEPTAICTDGEGNVYVTGQSDASGSGSPDNYDYATVKYSSSGELLWEQRYNGSLNQNDYAYALALDGAGNACVTGICNFSYDMNSADFCTIKYDSLGAELWVATYNGPGNGHDWPTSIIADVSGNFYVAGSGPVNPLSPYDYELATIKYDSDGQELWIQRYLGAADNVDPAAYLCPGDSGNIYLAGTVYSGASSDIVILKYNSNGALQWAQIFNGPAGGVDGLWAVASDGQGNVYPTGVANTGSSNDYATLKYSPSGVLQWIVFYNGPNNLGDASTAIAIGEDGEVSVTGYITTVSAPPWYWESEMVTIKYLQDPAVAIALVPVSQPIFLPPSGGSFEFTASLANYAPFSQAFDAWISVQLPSGSWYGPVLGPVALTLPAGGNLQRLRTQNVPGGAPAGTYVYRGYVGDYPAKWDSSSFTFEKLGAGSWGLGAGDWANSGEDFTPMSGSGATPTMKPLITSVSPNPFNATTAFNYQLQAPSHVNLVIYDTAGRLVQTLVDGQREAGSQEVIFDASRLVSGVYICYLSTGDNRTAQKLVLLK